MFILDPGFWIWILFSYLIPDPGVKKSTRSQIGKTAIVGATSLFFLFRNDKHQLDTELIFIEKGAFLNRTILPYQL
jgi:hypothetical protein